MTRWNPQHGPDPKRVAVAVALRLLDDEMRRLVIENTWLREQVKDQ